MKIVILDGQTQLENKRWDEYISTLVERLNQNKHQVAHFILKDMNIHHCSGCFGCWVKTPGQCVHKDDANEIARQVIQADFVLWASPLVLGFPSFHLKRIMDRSIPLVHPYFEVVEGEAHHLARYKKYPVFGLLMKPGESDDAEQLDLVKRIFARTALNIKSKLAFAETTDLPADVLVEKMEACRELVFQPDGAAAQPLVMAQIAPPRRLLVLNGSPRGKSGNTPIMLQKIADGFMSAGGTTVETLHLTQVKDQQSFAQAYCKADCVLLGFPLYTDGMPGIVKEFIEVLAHFENRKENPPMAFLVQSGFPEAAHSRHVERYLGSLAQRLNSPYLGTIVRGGSEGVRMMPDSMNRKLFKALNSLGAQLAQEGAFDSNLVREIASVEKYPAVLIPIFKLLLKFPFTQMYWDSQLKKNGAFERRFDQPYLEP